MNILLEQSFIDTKLLFSSNIKERGEYSSLVNGSKEFSFLNKALENMFGKPKILVFSTSRARNSINCFKLKLEITFVTVLRLLTSYFSISSP
ncbi:hypothetical protein D3C75_1091670 [compost metagenome]